MDIQFMRNNMTASMFDLSMKDKSRNPFGKLKDKIKGKNKDNALDTASAIVPSTTPSVDSDDESFSKDKKKKSKIKTLFSKPSLQKTPLSQSMSVLPTSKPDKVLLRPGDFQSRWGDEDDNEDESSSASEGEFLSSLLPSLPDCALRREGGLQVSVTTGRTVNVLHKGFVSYEYYKCLPQGLGSQNQRI